jgi:hypothetical protein
VVIYLDSSVALASLLTEPRPVPDHLWEQSLISSRLLEYEVWNRLHAQKLARRLGERAEILIGRVQLIELTPTVLARALEPFPNAPRTLDALHLATVDYARGQGDEVRLASYDNRMIATARAIGIGRYGL